MDTVSDIFVQDQANLVSGKVAPTEEGCKGRVYLFLQGHPSAFWRVLFRELQDRGAGCLKVNLCLGDSVFWLGAPATAYRGTLADWPDWLADYCRTNRVTDILYFADQHPYHRGARDVATAAGITCWTVEFGYLRPDWITLEQDGMGPLSHFPRTIAGVRALAEHRPLPDLKPRYLHSFRQEAFGEVMFNLLTEFGRPFFPHYRSDKALSPILDYLGWLPLLVASRRLAAAAAACERNLIATHVPYNLVALQMNGDYQIRSSSRFDGTEEFVEEVLASFARHAPADRQLIFKEHPLESGYYMWGRRIRRLARRHGLEARVQVIRGGDLHRLLVASKGVVLVNSTVGLHALRLRVPTCALGFAVYNIPGLAHQAGLDRFWQHPQAVDIELFETFERALTAIQVKGSFFNPDGRRRAVAEIATRLCLAVVD